MPSLTTLYRALVMVAVGAIVYYGWKHFGPSTEQVKSIVVQAVELAGRAWSEVRPAQGSPNVVNDPRVATPFGTSAPALTADPPPRPGLPPAVGGGQLVNSPTNSLPNAPSKVGANGFSGSPMAAPLLSLAPSTVAGESQMVAPPAKSSVNSEDDRLQLLYSQLEQLGAHDGQLKPWGSSGQLYRFRCSASLADSPDLSRHFESVAAEKVVAVQEVVAAVDAWRTAQRQSNQPR